MKWKNKNIFFLALSLVLLVGCFTPTPLVPEDPYFGYVYYKSITGDTKYNQNEVSVKLDAYKKQIASRELGQRMGKYNFSDKSLDYQAEYIDSLKVLIEIEEYQWKGAVGDSLNKKETKALQAYWNANQPLRFDGRKSLPEWAGELGRAEDQLSTDTKNADDLAVKIERLRKENNFREALKVVHTLDPYTKVRANELRKSLNKDASEYWADMRLKEVDKLRDTKPYDGFHEAHVKALYGKIKVDEEEFHHSEYFREVYVSWQDLLGENWRVRITNMEKPKTYWMAYQFAKRRYFDYVADTSTYGTYSEGLSLKLGDAYHEILDKAMRHYSVIATDSYKLNSLSGKAYVYCCMAKEMYDFNNVAKFPRHPVANEWYERISELEKNDLVPAIGSKVARRLVIHDFKLDRLGLSEKLRQSSLKKYDDKNNHAYGMKVITDTGTLEDLKNTQVVPTDYVVEWGGVDYAIKPTRGFPEQEFVPIKTTRTKFVENPFKKDRSSEFYRMKQVQAQEIDLYSLLVIDSSVTFSCAMDVSGRYRGQTESLEFPQVGIMVEKVNEKYGNVTTTKAKLLRENDDTVYYSSDVFPNSILPDPIPKDDVNEMPEDEWFEKSLVMAIMKDMENGLEQKIDVYPIELLADVNRNEPSQYLDSLGTVLFYVVNLSSKDAVKREEAGKGYKWLHFRNQVADNIELWCGTGERWETIGSGEKEIMKTLWGECVELAKNKEESAAAAESE